jgi:hypothetical protein
MTHRYGQVIRVTPAADRPGSFEWRGATYLVKEVLASWHLRDRWWERPAGGSPAGASDRLYFRVRCADEQVFDLYYDAMSDRWVLDRAHD